MPHLNRTIIVGKVVKGMTTKTDKNGHIMCSFMLESSYKKRTSTGDITDTVKLRILVYGNLAEHLVEVLKEGQEIIIDGRLVTKLWGAAKGEVCLVAYFVTTKLEGPNADAAPEDDDPHDNFNRMDVDDFWP